MDPGLLYNLLPLVMISDDLPPIGELAHRPQILLNVVPTIFL